MRLKKAVSVTLMAVMSLTLLAGCGSDGQQGSKEGGSDGAVFKNRGYRPCDRKRGSIWRSGKKRRGACSKRNQRSRWN